MTTLTTYPQLIAYWFNPKQVKVIMRLRVTRDFGTHFHRENILTKLAAAKLALTSGRRSV